MSHAVTHVLLLTLFILQFVAVGVWWKQSDHLTGRPAHVSARSGPRPLRPRTPDDCPHCRASAAAVAPAPTLSLVPYSQLKNRRGRPKSIDTAGFACPNPDCPYFGVTDPAIHALVGYGGHGTSLFIQDFRCQGCRRKFSARYHTPLYRLKTSPMVVAQVLHAMAEGLSPRAAARVFSVPETTVRTWLCRAGQHSQALHQRLLRGLKLGHVQLDELRVKLHGVVNPIWLWVTCDVTTKLIPAFAIGDRTQPMAHRLVHDLSQRLAAGELPVFSSDGLALYYYALTAHFGQWVQAASQRRRYWQVRPDMLYGQLVKRSRRRRLVAVDRRICLGQLETFRARLQAIGLTGCIQTAFIERLNLTIRRSLAALARRSWSAARSVPELTLQFDWWRAVYHFTRQHVGSSRYPWEIIHSP